MPVTVAEPKNVLHEDSEDIRLMRFELMFQLISPSFTFNSKSQPRKVFVQGYEYDTKKDRYLRRNERLSDAVKYQGNLELEVQKKVTFFKTLGGPINYSLCETQKWKLFIFGMFGEEEEDLLQITEKDENEIGSIEITVSELLMSLDRTVQKKIVFNSRNLKSAFSSGELAVKLVTPAPKTHILPRNINEEGTHLILKNDIAAYGDEEAKQMSITLKLMVKDIPIGNDEDLAAASPYFVVFKDSTQFKDVLYTSEVVYKQKLATFRVFSFGLANSKSIDKPMLIEFWNKHEKKKDEFVGIMRTDIYDLRNGTKDFNLIDPDIPYQFRGTVHVLKYEERVWQSYKVTRKAVSKSTGTERTFTSLIHKNDFSILNYLGYYEMRLAVAVDFTASNGQFPKDNKKSFHYIGIPMEGERKMNPYQITLAGVTEIITQYSRQVYIDNYGYGVQNSNKGFFRLQKKDTLSLEKPVHDAETLLKAYKKCVKRAQMGFNDNFYQIIEEVRRTAHQTLHYFVLLIVLDGDKIDVPKTLATLKETEKSGMSIVFVGIGDCPFKNLLMFQREFPNVTFVRYVEDKYENAKNALKDVHKHMLYHMAIRKNVPEEY